jgi:hypothetical protein
MLIRPFAIAVVLLCLGRLSGLYEARMATLERMDEE